MKYYIAENGQQAGPYEPNELPLHGLTVNSLVWCEGMPNWTSASKVPELMTLLSGQTINLGGLDTPLPPVPPMGDQQPQVSQIHPLGGQPTQQQQHYQQQGYYQPNYVQGQRPRKPDNNLVWAILCTLFCCLPFGIISIVYSSKVDSLYNAGNYDEAQDAANKAKNWAMWGAISCAIILVLYFFLIAIAGAAGSF